MTTTETKTRLLAVLRRGNLDERDRLILAAVWRGVRNYRALEKATGISLAALVFRILGHDKAYKRRGGGLVTQGWLRKEALIMGVIRPGPRFAGMDGDSPLEKVQGVTG